MAQQVNLDPQLIEYLQVMQTQNPEAFQRFVAQVQQQQGYNPNAVVDRLAAPPAFNPADAYARNTVQQQAPSAPQIPVPANQVVDNAVRYAGAVGAQGAQAPVQNNEVQGPQIAQNATPEQLAAASATFDPAKIGKPRVFEKDGKVHYEFTGEQLAYMTQRINQNAVTQPQFNAYSNPNVNMQQVGLDKLRGPMDLTYGQLNPETGSPKTITLADLMR